MSASDHPSSLSPSEADRLNPICERFEEQWLAGVTPDLEEFLSLAQDSDRPALLCQLLKLERHHRQLRGQQLQAVEYLERLPQFADIIAAFFASSPRSGEDVSPPDEAGQQCSASGNNVDLGEGATLATQDYPPPPMPPVSPPPAQPSRRKPPARPPNIPGYEILAYIDGGGQGEVYRARHLTLNRTVALKVLRDRADLNEEQLARFVREGKVLARLDYPHIIRIYDCAEWEGRRYISMELAEGGSLQAKLDEEHHLSPSAAAELLAVLAEAIQHAHDQDIVHRDLKPGNILFGREGIPKIADFGLAKPVAEDSSDLTQTRTILGTAAYMAPEQAAGSGKYATFATDIYGLGAILYTALTGQPPFTGKDWLDVLIQVRTESMLPPSHRQSGIPPLLEKICLKCLEKEPTQRYRTARELADDLRGFLAGGGVEAVHAEPDSVVPGPPQRTSDGVSLIPPNAFTHAGNDSFTHTGDNSEDIDPAVYKPPSIPGYEILGELGRGGMGIVYKARQLSLNRLVAVKVIIPHLRVNLWQRFRVEAQTVASLNHPHIVQVYDLGDHAGLLYIAMELMEGGSLDRLVRGEPQPPHAAAELIEQVAQAIGLAHQREIVHRDIKPANVLLVAPPQPEQALSSQARELAKFRYGFAKITDFGIVRLLGRSNEEKEGMIMGTPSYMPPEQASGRLSEVGPPSDVWELGATLYEMLTGRPPFKGANVDEVIQQVCSVDPVLPPHRLQPKVPRDLEAICLKCLQKDPAKRYADGLELADDLRRFLEGRAVRARPSGLWSQVRFWRKK